jgi:hypothetical protein
MPDFNVLLLSPTDSDDATLVASSQVPTLPVANLQTVQPQKKWRSTATDDYVLVTAAAPLAWSALALVGHNLTSAATLRVRGADSLDALTTAPAIDTGAVSAWPSTGKPNARSWPNWLSLVTWANTATLRFWRLDISDPANADGYLEAGRLVIGAPWQPTYNFDVSGAPIAFDALDTQTKTPFGYIFTGRVAQSPARAFNVQITATNRREVMDGIFEIQRLRGMWGDVICCLDPTETTDFHRFSMQGVFTVKPSYPITPQFDETTGDRTFGATIQLTEFL